jgi:two-component system chemotaxis response regulator CheB
MTRAIVVDDSSFVRAVLRQMMDRNGIEVAGEAANGREAIDLVRTHDPDVVTMDVEMPDVSGIEALETIMADNPTPVVMISAHTSDGAATTIEALEKGAVDFIPKPDGEVSVELSGFEDPIVETIETAARTDPEAGPESPTASSTLSVETVPEADVPPTIVIGASTGGPPVIERILSELPGALDARILVVQHMMDEFTAQFAERLDGVSEYDVAEAEHRARVEPGDVLVAKGGYHLDVRSDSGKYLRVALTEDEKWHSVRPAIDPTMISAASVVDGDLIGVVCTGMGSDGAAGISRIAEAGGTTIAQNNETAQVFGIPGQAIETGDVNAVVPVERIASTIIDSLSDGDTDE